MSKIPYRKYSYLDVTASQFMTVDKSSELVSESSCPSALRNASAPIVPIAAVSWFSVRDEINIPIEIKHIAISIMPIRHPISRPTFTFPHTATGIKNAEEMPIVIRNIVNAEKNFAAISPQSFIGEVRSSCSVPSFFSSERLFIVKSGRVTTYTRTKSWKYVEKSEVLAWSVVSVQRNAETHRNTPINT